MDEKKEHKSFNFDLQSYYEKCKNNKYEIRGFIDCNIKEGSRTTDGQKAIASLKTAGCPQHLLIELTQKYCKETGASFSEFSTILNSKSNYQKTASTWTPPPQVKELTINEKLEKAIIHYDNFILTINEKKVIVKEVLMAIRLHNCYIFDYSDGEHFIPISN